jgi:hypothetical protein
VQVVAMEGDVERAERDLTAGEIGDPAPQPVGERNAAGVDPNERDGVEIRIALDDLVGDPGKRPVQRLGVEQSPGRLFGGSQRRLLSGLTGPS